MKNIRYISALLAFCTIAMLCLCACRGEQKTPTPDLDSIKDELISRIESSKEVNDIFWGDGLPVIEIGSEEAEELGLYTEYNPITVDDYGEWEYIDPSRTDLVSILAIKELAETAYSDAFLSPVYTSQFVGLYDPVSGDVLNPHYYEDDYWLWKNANSEEEFPSVSATRLFNYETMKMDEDKSSGERIYVTVDSYIEGESEIQKITLVFDKQEDGWYLSSPTY